MAMSLNSVRDQYKKRRQWSTTDLGIDTVVGDPYFANVVSLLHFEGADGSTTFTDEKGITWTASGAAQIDTAQAKAGSSSMLVDGDGDKISSASISDFGFGTGDFTAECFVRTRVYQTGNRFIFDARVVGGNSWVLWCSQGGAENFLGWSTEAGTGFVTAQGSGHAFNAATWQHVALTRASGTVRGFIDGNLGFTTTDSRDYGTSQGLMIGSTATANQGMDGWIDEVRITKGVARYTSNFVVPVVPFPNS